MDETGLSAAEDHQIAQIRALDFEELQVEEVDGDDNSSSDDVDENGIASFSGHLSFNTNLASLHAYLGEVDDTHGRLALLDGGAVLTIPLFNLEGVVLFPEATLPLRVVQRNFIFAVERAMSQANAPFTIGVIHAWRLPNDSQTKFATVGTTAEIRQFRRLEDGSINLLARGQQRFNLKRRWIDVDGVSCGEVKIIEEDLPLRMPKDAFGKLTPLSNLRGCIFREDSRLNTFKHHCKDVQSDSDVSSIDSFENELSSAERELHFRALGSSQEYFPEGTSSEDEDLLDDRSFGSARLRVGKDSPSGKQTRTHGMKSRLNRNANLLHFRRCPRGFWAYWVYKMHDAYCLAERAADIWKQVVGTPSMDDLVRKPDLLSFSIASKIPASESIRQELLEINGISYRLRREIELLAKFDLIRCRTCKTTIARRSDIVVMSRDGPLNAYVNPHGYINEVMTLLKAKGLALVGSRDARYSWFPGYAWTIATCACCETQLGWLFTAIKSKNLKPQSFWAIRSCQVADDMK